MSLSTPSDVPWATSRYAHVIYFSRPLPTSFPVWVTVNAISVETPQEVLRAARGKSVTLPCHYQTSSSERDGVVKWGKLLRTHTVRVFRKLGALWKGAQLGSD